MLPHLAASLSWEDTSPWWNLTVTFTSREMSLQMESLLVQQKPLQPVLCCCQLATFPLLAQLTFSECDRENRRVTTFSATETTLGVLVFVLQALSTRGRSVSDEHRTRIIAHRHLGNLNRRGLQFLTAASFFIICLSSGVGQRRFTTSHPINIPFVAGAARFFAAPAPTQISRTT